MMDQDAWDTLSAALLVRMRWSWRDLQETPMSVVEAVIERLTQEGRRVPMGEQVIEYG